MIQLENVSKAYQMGKVEVPVLHGVDLTIDELSGGQQQRVAIARALINDPASLLADEPTGNLDSAFSLEIMKLLGALNDAGRTVVIITHEEEIAQFAKRVLRMRDGHIEGDQVQRGWTEPRG